MTVEYGEESPKDRAEKPIKADSKTGLTDSDIREAVKELDKAKGLTGTLNDGREHHVVIQQKDRVKGLYVDGEIVTDNDDFSLSFWTPSQASLEKAERFETKKWWQFWKN